MILKNKKGFTMVELLATIAIIAVLTTLAIVGVNGVRNSLKSSYYKRVEKLVVAAGMDYYNDHKGERPVRIGQSSQVALSELEGQAYIEDVKDYTKQSCDAAESYVLITKTGEKKYKYDTYLKCPDHNGTEPEKGSTTPKVGPGATDCSDMLSSDATGSGWSHTSINLLATKTSDIESYEIQKQNGSKWETIGSTHTADYTLAISDNGVSTYRAVGRHSNGAHCTSNTVNIQIDKDNPRCGAVTGESTSWTKNPRTISIACSDGEKESGCVEPTYQNTFSADTKVGTITIADKAGNTTDCPVNAYIDTTPPTCGTATGTSTSWTKSSRTITQPCTDNVSGCNSVSTTYSSTTKTASVTVTDGAGNTQACPAYNVYVDTTPPTCGSASGGGTSSSHKFGNVTVSVGCSDSHSGCGSSSYSKTFSPTTTTSTIAIADKASNSRSCSVNVYAYPCSAPTVSGSVATTRKCPYNGETLSNTKTVTFTVGGCRNGMTSSNSYICHYNTKSTVATGWSSDQKRHNKIVEIGCGKVKCGYHSSNWHGSCKSSTNHGAFTGSGTKWSLNRSTECTYIKAVSDGGTKEMTCNMSTGKCVTGVSAMIKNC